MFNKNTYFEPSPRFARKSMTGTVPRIRSTESGTSKSPQRRGWFGTVQEREPSPSVRRDGSGDGSFVRRCTTCPRGDAMGPVRLPGARVKEGAVFIQVQEIPA